MVLKKEKYHILEQQLIQAAAKIKADYRANFIRFVPHFIASFSIQDIDSLRSEDAFRHAYALFRHFLATKKTEPNLHIFTPSQKTYIHLVVRNVPFVIASLLNIFVEKRIYIHSQQNFILKAQYKNNRPYQLDSGEEENIVIRFVVETLSEQEVQDCSYAIITLCHSLIRSAMDWHPMEEQLVEAMSHYHRTAKAHREDGSKIEFIHWLKEKRCIFLGCYRQKESQFIDPLGICYPSVLTDELKKGLANIPPRYGIHFTKTQVRSIIHRPVYLDMISIGTSRAPAEEYRFLILYAFDFFNVSIESIPYLSERVRFLLSDFNAQPATYKGRVLRYAISAYPRDQLVQILDRGVLRDIVAQMLEAFSYTTFRSVFYYDEKRFFANVVVIIPREDYDSQVRNKMEQVLHQALGTTHNEFAVLFTEMRMALVFFTFPLNTIKKINQQSLAEQLREIGTSWERQLRAVLLQQFGEQEGISLYKRSHSIFPSSYKEDFSAEQAGQDIKHLLIASKEDPHIELISADGEEDYRLRLFDEVGGLTLSRLVHLLENSGADLIASRFYRFHNARQTRLVEFRLLMKIATEPKWEAFKEVYQDNIRAIYRNEAEDDSFNKLSLSAAMRHRHISLLRAWSAYLAQVQGHYGRDHIEAALRDNPHCAQILIEYFNEKFSPQLGSSPSRYRRLSKRFTAALALVESLEQDQILRQMRELIVAMDRTNFYLNKQILSFKIRPQRLSYLSEPQPLYEIFVYAANFEGVHLRAGLEARGGIRWSDRRASYRLEIYNLLQAQIIKNAIIVPTGAKGGFYIKNPHCDGVSIYRQFIESLLELTDNLKEKVIPPPGLRIYDEADPYLVVAPDKGTADFSDIANQISRQGAYWLDDAFASSGSSGYNHKEMGITARGAWESVCRHCAEKGINATSDTIEVIGVGDMSGDVFGNGMLLSPKIKLIAAFNHRAIFIDPNPDPAASFKERQRLFNLPNSSWDDYNRAVLSSGGAIFSRHAKKLSLGPSVRKKFAIREQTLTPDQLISRILRGRAELLWFGGIGTYVKARHENNSEVGDKANDAIRVNADELNALVIGEGANLGMTMAARIEFASQEGKVATDSNDNSGGVHCSDREVNIKILLSLLERKGKISNRDRLLKDMTAAVAEQVLAENYSQNLALSLENWQASSARIHHIQIAQQLNVEAELELSADGSVNPLTKPQLAVLIGHYKNALKQALHQPLDYPYLRRLLPSYYPPRLRALAGDAVFSHPLANRMLTTLIVNNLVDQLGLAFSLEETEELPLSAQCFYPLNDLFSFIPVTQSLASHYSIYPSLLPFLHSLTVSQLNALRWLRHQGSSPPSDETIKKWRKQLEHCLSLADSHPFFNHSYQTLSKLGIDNKQAAAAVLAQKADSLILLLPLMKKENSALVLELFQSLNHSLAVSQIQLGLNKMQGQSNWRRALAQDMWLSLGHQLSRIIKSLLAEKAAGSHQLISEWQSRNHLILGQYHRALQNEQLDASLIQFLIGLLSKLNEART